MKRSLAALLLACTLLATACGGGDDGGTDTGTGTGAADDEDVALDPDGVLRYASPLTSLSSFDPHKATVSQNNPPLFLTYDRLVHMDAEGNEMPGLATEWEFSEDGLALTFTLREGVTFHDGTPFDAEAARANLLRVRDMPESVPKADLNMVADVEVTGPYEIRLALEQRAPQLPLVLSDRTGSMVSPAAFDKPDLDRAPVGSGMYKVTEYVPNDHITYVRNDDYWDPDAVQMAGVEFKFMGDPKTRLNALRSGQIDWTEVAALDFKSLENDPNLETEVFEGLAYNNIMVNRSRPALQDVRVRQALNHGINRQALNQVLVDGLGTVCDQAFPPGYFAHNEEIGCEHHEYDVAKAKALLAEAGYAGGLTLDLLTGTTPVAIRNAEAIQAQYAEIGLTINIVPDPVAGTSWVVDHKGDIFIAQWGGRASPYTTILQQFMEGGATNAGNDEDPDLAEVYREAEAAADADEQVEKLQEAAGVLVEKALEVPLWFTGVPTAWHTKVVGPEAYLGGKQEFRGVGIAAG